MLQTVELYYPTSEYDLETISAVLYGFASVVVMVLVTMFACFPDKKIPIVSDFFEKVNQLEKSNIRTLSTKVRCMLRRLYCCVRCKLFPLLGSAFLH